MDDPTIASSDGKYSAAKIGNNNGYMIEGNYHVKPEFALRVRYDGFDPTDEQEKQQKVTNTQQD